MPTQDEESSSSGSELEFTEPPEDASFPSSLLLLEDEGDQPGSRQRQRRQRALRQRHGANQQHVVPQQQQQQRAGSAAVGPSPSPSMTDPCPPNACADSPNGEAASGSRWPAAHARRAEEAAAPSMRGAHAQELQAGWARMHELSDNVAQLERIVSLLAATAEQQRRREQQRQRYADATEGGRGHQSHPAPSAAPLRHAAAPPLQALLAPQPFTRTHPASSASIVCVQQLPRPHDWDDGWDALIRGMQTLDLLVIHKQWLQWCALKLPRIEFLAGRPEGEQAAREMAELYERYDVFTRRVMRLAPLPWKEMVNYSLDPLGAPLERPPTAEYLNTFIGRNSPDALQKIQQVREPFQEGAAVLREEQARLRARYEQVLASAGDSVAIGLGHPAGNGTRSSAHKSEAELLLQRMDSNMRLQELHLANCVHAVNFALPATVMMQVQVMLYPLAVNGQLLLAS